MPTPTPTPTPPATPDQAAARIAALIEPVLARELEAGKAQLLARLGLIGHALVSHHWDALEAETRRVVRSALTAACSEVGTLSINETIVRLTRSPL